MTPNIERIVREVTRRWPDAKSWGIYNCRKIAGSTTWSQHAWKNAWDITSPNRVLVAGPRTRANPLHMKYLDEIDRFLRTNRLSFEINTLLWRVSKHYDHIHVDTWRKGVGLPPCAGGNLRTKDKYGNYYDDWGDEDMAKAVEGIQRNLNATGYRDQDGNELEVDGEWGPKTEYAHQQMCANKHEHPHQHVNRKTGPPISM